MHKEDIRLIPRLSKEGIIHGITYVDLKTKCVFNGSALGKKYSAKAILESIHLKTGSVNTGAIISAQKPTSTIPKSITRPENSVGHNTPQQDYTNEKSIMELLTQYEFAASSVPYEWRKKKRKRKRRIS
ncbi:hypothetical protein [Sphingobacterium siyangense]|uniref:hypothetical protein n=1 Tax=Sphingobacterium siyangense TaxID=459529 RepID=UPI00301984CD